MQETPLSTLIKTRQIGPVTAVLKYLDVADLKKLSFVISRNRKEMSEIFDDFHSLSLFGKKMETNLLPKIYIPDSLVQTMHQFAKKKSIPVNQITEDESKHVHVHHLVAEHQAKVYDILPVLEMIGMGRKIPENIFDAILIADSRLGYSIIECLMETYNDKEYVMNMLPMKSLAIMMSMAIQRHYHGFLGFYVLFGFGFILRLMNNRASNHQDCYTEYGQLNTDTSYDIIDEGKKLLELIYLLSETYPFLYDERTLDTTNVEHKFNLEMDTKRIRWSIDDIYKLLENDPEYMDHDLSSL